MPLINDFKSTNVWKAFLLNSLAATITIFVALMIKSNFDTYTDKHGDQVKRHTNVTSVIATLLITFIAGFGSYMILYFLFGFGGGMLVAGTSL